MFDVDESGGDFAHIGESRLAAQSARVVIEGVPVGIVGVAPSEFVAAQVQRVEFGVGQNVGIDVGAVAQRKFGEGARGRFRNARRVLSAPIDA